MDHFNHQLVDLLATGALALCWGGYTLFSRLRAKKVYCLTSTLDRLRKQWITRMLRRDNRIGDVAMIGNLERNSSFLASTSVLLIAGLATAVASAEQIHSLLAGVPLASADFSAGQVRYRLIVLLAIHVFAFFSFTWSMRQYGFGIVMLGAAPMVDEESATNELGARFAVNFARLLDEAGDSYNYGLRAYYFSLTIIAWLFSVWLFLASVAVVVGVLYFREFHSSALHTMMPIDRSVGELPSGRW